MTDNRNTILAVILSGLVLIAWQFFYNMPQMEKQRAAERAQSELVKPAAQGGSTATPRPLRRPARPPRPRRTRPRRTRPRRINPPPQHLSTAKPPLPRHPESGSTPRGS